MTIAFTPLTDVFGVEADGVDLNEPLSPEDCAAVRRALAEHLVVVFHGQNLDADGYLRAMQQLGEPMLQHYSQYNMGTNPMVGVLSSKENAKSEEGRRYVRGSSSWHTDHINHERPPFSTILYALKLPSQGGDTSFADMRAAYKALPDEWRRRVDPLQTVNQLDREIVATPEDQKRYAKPAVHPLVRVHPETGERALYFHPTKCAYIEGMQPEESWRFLDELMDVSIKPEFTYRHKWQVGDVVMCDNRAALHKAHADYNPDEGRLLYRVVLRD